MTLRSVAGHRIGEDTADLERWLLALEDCPTITHTHVVTCSSPVHDEPANWFYVEADAKAGVIRRRCLACGMVAAALDSEERWSHPHMWSCDNCRQSIAEVVAGMHAPGGEDDAPGVPGPVTWMAIGVRCVGCGTLAGVTDFLLPATRYDEVVTNL